MTRALLHTGAVLALAAIAACDNGPTVAPTSTTTTTTTTTTPQTFTVPGILGAGGTATRTLTVQIAGTASAAITDITPSAPLVVGFGLPTADLRGCLLGYSATATDGASASAGGTVDAGTFCVQVASPKTGPEEVRYTLTVSYP